MCSIKSGSPPFRFQWLKDGVQLSSEGFISILTAEDLSSLTFRQLKPSDVGNYTCIVRNEQGLDSHTAPLLVRCKLFSSYFNMHCNRSPLSSNSSSRVDNQAKQNDESS